MFNYKRQNNNIVNEVFLKQLELQILNEFKIRYDTLTKDRLFNK